MGLTTEETRGQILASKTNTDTSFPNQETLTSHLSNPTHILFSASILIHIHHKGLIDLVILIQITFSFDNIYFHAALDLLNEYALHLLLMASLPVYKQTL